MKKLITITFIAIAFLSCEKEEVQPKEINKIVPVVSKPKPSNFAGIDSSIVTNNVIITLNSTAQVSDSIRLSTVGYIGMTRITDENEEPYYLCNLTNNMFSIMLVDSDCNDKTIKLTGWNKIYVEYKGDVTVEYLPSTL